MIPSPAPLPVRHRRPADISDAVLSPSSLNNALPPDARSDFGQWSVASTFPREKKRKNELKKNKMFYWAVIVLAFFGAGACLVSSTFRHLQIGMNHRSLGSKDLSAQEGAVENDGSNLPNAELEPSAPFEGIPGSPSKPKVDYNTHQYTYPNLVMKPPVSGTSAGGYPKLTTLGNLMEKWDQDNLDDPPSPIVEVLQHFDYRDPKQREAALLYREAELPFKVTNVPEVLRASVKWQDDAYVQQGFDEGEEIKKKISMLAQMFGKRKRRKKRKGVGIQGHVQVSRTNFFVYFVAKKWNRSKYGPEPTQDIFWNYTQWAKAARDADTVGLSANETHYYLQAGVPFEQRFRPQELFSFVSRDLPTFSGRNPTFFCNEPKKSKGIQCRFGMRGVTAATHYDAGRNMIAMVMGAKRYVLAPPKACKQLGIIPKMSHPGFRHSFLNFGRINYLSKNGSPTPGMDSEDEQNLREAATSPALETVVKRGEVLYLPSHWFHYITSLQMSAQCNTRSGRDFSKYDEFGGFEDVDEKCDMKKTSRH